MKKKSVASIIIIYFFKTFGIILLLLAVGVLSYYLTMLYYNQTERKERSTQYTHVIDVNTGNESSNLIYSYDEKTKKIKAMVLELFDETTTNMNFITIPADTQISISSKKYSELMKVSQQIPQLFTMEDINEYFTGDVAYEYGIMILQEQFHADIGYFTAIPSDTFDKFFEKNSKKKKKLVYQPSEALLNSASQCDTEAKMNDFIEEMWDDMILDITLSQKQHYSAALARTNRDYIRTRRAYGSKSGDVFLLDEKKNRKLVNDIWESEAYDTPQKSSADSADKKDKDSSDSSSGTKVSSAGRSIWITNGSGINGLAATYKEKLEADGLIVTGTGNYDGVVQKKTRILVTKKKLGKDLLKYFKDATIEKVENTAENPLNGGADIEIILGTQDKLS